MASVPMIELEMPKQAVFILAHKDWIEKAVKGVNAFVLRDIPTFYLILEDLVG